MAFTKAQKKYIKKHARHEPLPQLAAALGVGESEVSAYLKQSMGDNAFRARFGRRNQALVSPDHPQRIFGFRKYRYIYAGLFLLVCAAYANSLGNAFVSDDVRYLVDNPAIRSFSFVYATPITMFKALVNWLTYTSFGLAPWAFHSVNILFHLLTVWSLFAILNRFVRIPAAAAAAAVVAVHPVFTESVTWIGGGGYVMYGSLFLLSLLLYTASGTSKRRYVGSVVSFSLSLLSSEKAIPLALMFPVYEMTVPAPSRRLRRTVPFLLLSGVWMFLFFVIFRYAQTRVEALSSQFYISGYYNPLTQIPVAVSSYLSVTLFPRTLSFFYSQLAFPLAEMVLRAAVTLLFFAVTCYAFVKNRLVFLFLILVPVSLSPSLTPLVIAWVVAERYGYLAAVGIIVAVVVVAFRYLDRPRVRTPLLIGTGVIVSLLLVRTVVRNFDWTNEDTLWFATYRTAPMDPRVHTNVGDYYRRHKEFDRAEAEFKKAIELSKTRAIPYYDLAKLYYDTGKPDAAIPNLERAITLDQGFTDAYKLLTSVYYESGKYDMALRTLDKLKARSPDNAVVYINYGKIYEKLGDRTRALTAYRKAALLDPANEAAVSGRDRLEHE